MGGIRDTVKLNEVVIFGAVLAAGWFFVNRGKTESKLPPQEPGTDPNSQQWADYWANFVNQINNNAPGVDAAGQWEPPPAAAPFLDTIYSTERAQGIPHNLLARLLYQESHFRSDIINGTTVSPAGAVGIAQFAAARAA